MAQEVVYDAQGNLLGYRRTQLSIYASLQALTTAQQNAVWLDLSSGSPKKYLTDDGRQEGGISALDWIITRLVPVGAALLDAKLRVVAAYVQDNPLALVNPAFDPTINVPGYVPIP